MRPFGASFLIKVKTGRSMTEHPEWGLFTLPGWKFAAESSAKQCGRQRIASNEAFYDELIGLAMRSVVRLNASPFR
ncbi:MAG: hypothetical protein NVS3B29_07790 [Candidatus Saccharimonadales bacterium]